MKYLYPISPGARVTQSYAEHVARAKANGWCSKPGNCPGGVYYYGGIDWAVPMGTPVRAAQDGRVTIARQDGSGYGVHARIQHGDGSLTVYGHLQNLAVKAGDMVKAGQVIGLSNNTGNSSGPHLHFELRDPRGVPVDPSPLLVAELPGEPEPVDPEPVEPTPGPPPEPEPQPAPPTSPEPTEFPALHRVRVVAAPSLSIRQAAGTTYPRVGYLPTGTEVDVLRGVRDGADVWLQIGYYQWIAQRFGGETLAAWL